MAWLQRFAFREGAGVPVVSIRLFSGVSDFSFFSCRLSSLSYCFCSAFSLSFFLLCVLLLLSSLSLLLLFLLLPLPFFSLLLFLPWHLLSSLLSVRPPVPSVTLLSISLASLLASVVSFFFFFFFNLYSSSVAFGWRSAVSSCPSPVFSSCLSFWSFPFGRRRLSLRHLLRCSCPIPGPPHSLLLPCPWSFPLPHPFLFFILFFSCSSVLCVVYTFYF